MNYQFKVKVTPFDFFRLSMHRTYHSLAGVCNIIFTIAFFLLIYRFFNKTNDVLEALMVIGCLLFPVLQPLAVYIRAKAQVAVIPQDLIFSVDDRGVHISTGEQKETIKWEKIKGIVREYKMLIVFSDESHGYILTDRVLGKEKETFFDFVNLKLVQNR